MKKILKTPILELRQKAKLIFAKGKRICFWSFEGVVDERRIKVIIKRVGQGKKHFWSVIPNWRRDRFGKTTKMSAFSLGFSRINLAVNRRSYFNL